MTQLAAVTAGLILGAPCILSAQIQINGQVVDNGSLAPIAGAEVRIQTARGRGVGRVLTDDYGRFTFTVRRDGGYLFKASRIGYRANQTPILWTDGFRAYELEIRLDADAILLAPIEVLARSRPYESPVLESFRERIRTGSGHYFTREDISRMNPARISDLLVQVPGVHLRSTGAGLQRVVTMSRIGGGGACPAEVFVDGMRWSVDVGGGDRGGAGFTVDDAASPAAVVGIEVYPGLSTVPPEFLTPTSRCGVVAIWTRRSGD